MLNVRAQWAEDRGMTFAKQLDAILAGAEPTTCPNVLPDDANHAWFVDLHIQQQRAQMDVPQIPLHDQTHLTPTPRARNEQHIPQRVAVRHAWSTEQCRALAVLRLSGSLDLL